MTKRQKVAAAMVGRAIARDVLADAMPREWTGLDPQDGDQLRTVGIEPGSDAWLAAEEMAARAYREALERGYSAAA